MKFLSYVGAFVLLFSAIFGVRALVDYVSSPTPACSVKKGVLL